ncbi:MAG: hypothetical protein ACLFNW_08485 [Desulfobacterales bacterium]
MIRNKEFYSDFENEMDYANHVLQKSEDISPGEENMIASLERQQTRLETQKMRIQQDIEAKQKQLSELTEQINRIQGRIADLKVS